jgi:YbbR domain-containing protein
MIELIFRRWPLKLGALFLAAFMWFFVTLNDASISQRTDLVIPVIVEGLSENQIPSGVPEYVNLVVSGPSNRVDRLTEQNFSAILDLSDVSGSFSKQIDVVVPPGIILDNVRPNEAIGVVELRTSRTMPVTIAYRGQLPTDVTLHGVAEPATVTLTGRASVLEQVAVVLATVSPNQAETTTNLIALNAEGRPVADISYSPSTVTITVESFEVLHTKLVDLTVEQPDVSPYELVSFEVQRDAVRLAGPYSALNELERVTGTVELDTTQLASGEYTLNVQLELPNGVAALETVEVALQLAERDSSLPLGDAQ